MKYPAPLISARLIRRYKRFLADVEFTDGPRAGAFETVHCANPGSMMGLAEPGSEIWLSPAANPKRKLRYTWELVRVGRSLVGVNPGLANRLVAEAIGRGRIEPLAGYRELTREVRLGERSRIDFALDDPTRGRAFVEVKSVTLRPSADRRAAFPDAVTARGTKHLRELATAVRAGHRAVMLYVVQRGDCARFGLAADIDPAYAAAYADARAAGVEAYCYRTRVARQGIDITAQLPILEPADD